MNRISEINKFNSKVRIFGASAVILLFMFIPLGSSFADAACLPGYCTPILSVSVTTNKNNALPGDDIIYTITYRNSGGVRATGIVIKDPFFETNKDYFDFVGADPVPDSGKDTWIIDEPLEYNESGQIIVRVKIKSYLPSNLLEIKNQASIDSNETTPQYSRYNSIFVISTCRLTLTQLVRNVSANSSFSQSVNADPGDEIEFSLEIKSQGTNQSINTRIWDTLPSRLKYVLGSTIIDNSFLGDGVVSGGMYLGNILSGATKIVKFRVKAGELSSFYVGKNILRNLGYVSANGCVTMSSSSSVVIIRESTSLTVITSSGLSIDQLARNLTKKNTYWSNNLYVNPGDEVEFLIKIKSTKKETNSVRVETKLPPKMFYISDSTTVDGNFEPDGITTKNVYLADVYPNLTREIRFKVKMAPESEFNLYPISLVNEASAWGNDGKEIKDNVKIIVNRPANQSSVKGVSIVSGQSISIIKTGRNLSKNQSALTDSLLADPGDELEFSVQVNNNGTVDLNNVKMWENLPNNISIIEGSTTVNGANWGGDVIGSGLNFEILKRGATKIIKFRARVDSAEKFGSSSTTLVCTTFVSGDNISQSYDQVSVIVHKSGEVKGAVIVKTGFNYFKLLIIFTISIIIAFILYCVIREEKLLEILNSKRTGKFRKSVIGLYFRTKLLFKLNLLKLKKKHF